MKTPATTLNLKDLRFVLALKEAVNLSGERIETRFAPQIENDGSIDIWADYRKVCQYDTDEERYLGPEYDEYIGGFGICFSHNTEDGLPFIEVHNSNDQILKTQYLPQLNDVVERLRGILNSLNYAYTIAIHLARFGRTHHIEY